MSAGFAGHPGLAEFGETIFAEMSALAVTTQSINLGQGFPDTDGPQEVLDAAAAALAGGVNQYPPLPGEQVLREAVAEHQERFWGLSFDPASEVLVTAGATEALAASLMAFVRPGDDVVVFEPYYDSYAAGIALAGGNRRVVTLRPPQEGLQGFQFDIDELRAAITDKARVLLLNTPHNPTGKVFTRTELMQIAELALDRDLLVISDEVYEHLTFDDSRHIPIATLPGMADRTITISSGGKSFSFTGWKVGWACGRPDLIASVRAVKQFLTFVNAAPFQPAIAAGLRLGDDFFRDFAAELQAKRDRLNAGLESAGFDVFSPQGTYFTTVDIRSVGGDDCRDFCLALPERVGVVAIPSSVFYTNKHEGRHLVRFAFCKQDHVLDAAVERLQQL
ncbi:MAG: pyridoxal phosphate-dependent aminotransferase [Actinomycetota bacterium]